MDPMDYAMDEGALLPSQPAQRYQCQNQHQPPNPTNVTPQSRDGTSYDPVYDSFAWSQHHNPNSTRDHPFTHTQTASQWSPAPFTPIHNWQTFTGMQRPVGQSSDHSGQGSHGGQGDSRHGRAYLDMPWNSSREIDPLSYTYGDFGNNAEASRGVNMHNTSSSTGPPPGIHRFSGHERDIQASLVQQEAYRVRMSHINRLASTPVQASTPLRSQPEQLDRRSPVFPFAGTRGDFPRLTRPHGLPRNDGPDGTRPLVRSESGRRVLSGWDSDDDDDDDFVSGLERYRPRREEDLVSAELDEERSLAAMRGVLASGKRIPSKETLASLEVVDLSDLKESDKTCIICYNEFGVSNPEGVTEKPIRLPKCKHVFGDKCIKKWFEDSDSCPYCRDKLPSELAFKKHQLYQNYRLATRELRFAHLGHRARYGLSGASSTLPGDDIRGESRQPGSLPTQAQRAQEEYETMMTRHVESLGYSPLNRVFAESPERRRPARGRVGSNRASYMQGRPASIGSARQANPPFNHQISAYRAFGLGSATQQPSGPVHGPRRSITPGLPRPAHDSPAPATNPPPNTSGPPRYNRASGVPASASSPEEASPPVAVGSGVSSSTYSQAESSNRALRLEIESSSGPLALQFSSRQPSTNPNEENSHGTQPHPLGFANASTSFGIHFGAVSSLQNHSQVHDNGLNLLYQQNEQGGGREPHEEPLARHLHPRWSS